MLGIETSCDETGVGIVRGTELLANVDRLVDGRARPLRRRRARGRGARPPRGARARRSRAALAEAGVTLADLDAIAVTSGPGLAGALMVGVGAAKALALALDKPLYAVNHLVGHVGADLLDDVDDARSSYPTIALLVSGGHTSLLLVRDLIDDVELLGETIDDAAGEAFDKVARLLGLPYPGGPQIDRAAAGGDPNAIRFPRGLTLPEGSGAHRYDFSFSGLKTAVARWVEQQRDAGEEVPVADVAASFREAVADVLAHARRSRRAPTSACRACCSAAASSRTRGCASSPPSAPRPRASRCASRRSSLCTDNGAMIAALGAQLDHGRPRAVRLLDFRRDSTLPVTQIQVFADRSRRRGVTADRGR